MENQDSFTEVERIAKLLIEKTKILQVELDDARAQVEELQGKVCELESAFRDLEELNGPLYRTHA